jgi:hypothetical protein
LRFSSLILGPAIALAFFAAPALAQSPAPSTMSAPGQAAENPTLTKLAREQLDAFRAGKIDRSLYASDANSHITDALVTQVSQLLGRGGAVKSFTYSDNVMQAGAQVSQYAVTFERPIAVPEMPTLPTTDQWICSIATDKDGKISYLLFAPKQ